MPQTLLDSSRYKTFVHDRDKALEKIHQNAQVDLSRILFEGLDKVEMLAGHLAMRSNQSIISVHPLSKQFEIGVDDIFSRIFPMMIMRIKRLRRAIFTLTYASELEAIGQATQRRVVFSRQEFKRKMLKALNSKTLLNHTIENRVWYNLVKLRHRITSAFSLALVQELEPKEVLKKVKTQFPEIRSYRRPPKNLKPIKEADANQVKKKDFYDYSFIDDEDWDLATQAYIDTELPPSRFDNYPERDPESGFYKYNWELEQEMTDDFVKQVRDGQMDAANDLGIKEFVWVSIIDDKTDDCCLWRNGKTTTEIEQELEGDHSDDECDGSSPPIHFNCRCQLAPTAGVDEVEGPDWKSFDEWLDS